MALRLSPILCVCTCIALTVSAPTAGYAASEEQTVQDGTEHTTVYLKSGEVFTGTLVEKSETAVVIERQGYKFPFMSHEVDHIEQGKLPTPAETNSKPAFSTAIITYDYTGWKTGKETVYVDRAQNRIASESATTQQVLGSMEKDSDWMIYDGKVMYTVDLEKNLALKIEREGDILSEVFGKMCDLGNPVGQDVVLEKACAVHQYQGTKVCCWVGVPLREEVVHPFGEKYNFAKTAVDLQVDISLPGEKFVLPAGVTVQTAEAMIDELGSSLKTLFKKLEKSGTGTSKQQSPDNAR